MPAKYLVEFLAEWIRNEDLRCKALYREKTTLKDWGLSQKQIDDLISLDEDRIFERLRKELKEEFAVELREILEAFAATGGQGPGGGAAAMVYDEGYVHVRGVDPARIKKGMESVVIVRGHGWDDSLEIWFVPDNGANVKGTVLDVDCDVDVWQRATVSVTLPSAGDWRVMARIPGNQQPDSAEDVKLVVVG